MAQNSEAVLIEVQANTAAAVAGIEQLNAQVKTLQGQVSQSTDNMAMSMAGFVAKIGAVIAGFKTMYDEAVKSQQAEAQLTLALKNNTTAQERNGVSVSKTVKEYASFSKERQKITGIEDDETQALMALLVQMQVAPGQIKEATSAIQDMAAGMGQEGGAGAARALARALGDPIGSMGALKRAGVILNEELLKGKTLQEQQAIILGEVSRRFSGQAEVVNQSTYGFKSFTAQLADIAETIGKVVFPMIQKIMTPIADLIAWLLQLDPPIQNLIMILGGLGLALTGPIGLITGLVIALAALSNLLDTGGVSAKQLADEMNGVNDSIKELENTNKQIASNDSLLKALKKATVGTAEYETLIKRIIKENPSLIDANISAATSYVEVAKKVAEVNRQLRFKKALEAEQAGYKAASTAAAMRRQIEAGGTGATRATTDPEALAAELASAKFQKMIPGQWGGGEVINPEWQARFDLELLTIKRNAEQADEATRTAYFNALKDTDQKLVLLAQQLGQAARDTGSGEEKFLAQLKSVPENKKQFLIEEFRRAREGTASYSTSVDETVFKPGGGDGKGGGAANFYDIEKLRQDVALAALEGYAKKRKEIDYAYANEKKAIDKADFKSATERQEALALIAEKRVIDIAELEKEMAKEAANKFVSDTTEGIGILTNVVKGDFTAAFTGAADALGKSLGVSGVGGLVGGIIGLGSMIVDIFASSGKTAAERFAESWANAMGTVETGSAAADAVAQLIGEETAQSIQGQLEGAGGLAQSKKTLLALLGIREEDATPEAIAEMIFSGRDAMQVLRDRLAAQIAQRDKLDPMTQAGAWNEINKQIEGTLELIKVEGIRLKNLEALAPILAKTNDLQLRAKMVAYQERLTELEHERNTGQIDEAEYLNSQLAIYDEMIANLNAQGVAHEDMKAIEEERYQIEQKILGLQKDGLQIANKYKEGAAGAQLTDMLSKLAKLRADIASGAVRGGSYGAVMAEQALIQGIMGNLAAQGATDAELQPWRDALATLAKNALGEAGFAAASGAGVAVSVPGMPGSVTNNTSSAQTVQIVIDGRMINAGGSDWQAFLQYISRQTGQNLVGA